MKSVKTKLIGSFAIVLVFLVVLGYTGLTQIKKINNFTTEVTTHWMFGIQAINEVNLNIERFLGNYYQQMLAAGDPEQLAKLNETSNEFVKAIDQGIKDYATTVSGEEDANHYENLRKAWMQFQAGLSVTSSAQASKEQKEKANQDIQKAFSEARAAVDALIAYNRDGAAQSEQESEKIYDSTSTTLVVFGIAIFVVVSVLASGLIVNLIRPLNAATSVMNRIAAGDLTATTLRVNRSDEFGAMMESVNKTLLALQTSVRQMQDASTAVAAASAQLYAGSEQNSEAARHVSESMAQVASGSEEQAVAATESARVIDEMAEGVQRIAATTGDVSEMSQQAAQQANAGSDKIVEVSDRMQRLSETVDQAGQTISRLEERSAQIGEISGLIGDIAYRTNLLALNAAIEAARAGEHGKGFAVVAGEVRKLASQSDESAKGIMELISTIQHDTNNAAEAMRLSLLEVQQGVEAVEQAEQAFKEIVDSTGDVSSRVQEAAAAAEQLAASSEEVAASIANMGHIARQTAGMSQQVAATTEEQLASSEEMTRSSQNLSDIAKDLQALVKKFRI